MTFDCSNEVGQLKDIEGIISYPTRFEEISMALAQVVYQISTDKSFASRMQSDPHGALHERGWSLSKEEIAFLLSTLRSNTERSEIRRIVKPLWFRGWM